MRLWRRLTAPIRLTWLAVRGRDQLTDFDHWELECAMQRHPSGTRCAWCGKNFPVPCDGGCRVGA